MALAASFLSKTAKRTFFVHPVRKRTLLLLLPKKSACQSHKIISQCVNNFAYNSNCLQLKNFKKGGRLLNDTNL